MKSKKFSLIELMVAVAIISILISLLSPSLARIKINSEQVGCQQNLRKISVTQHIFLGDHDGLFWFFDYQAGSDLSQYYSKWTANENNNLYLHGRGLPTFTSNGLQTVNERRPLGFGILRDYGYLEDLKPFYCPSNTYEDSYSDHGPEIAEIKYTNKTYMKYDYSAPNSLITPRTLLGADDDFYPDDDTVCGSRSSLGYHSSRWDGDLPMLVDLFRFRSGGSFYEPHELENFNVMYFDGVVKQYDLLSSIPADMLNYGTMYSRKYQHKNWMNIYRLRAKESAGSDTGFFQ